MSYRDANANSPSLSYVDAPDEPTVLSELVESPSERPSYLHTDGDDVLELQPSPPQTPQHGQQETTLRDDTVGEGSLSVDVSDDNSLSKADGMHSVVQSPMSVTMPVAAPANSVPVAVPHHLPVAAPAPAAQPVAAAVVLPPPPPPPPVDPVIAERAAKRAAFFKAQAARSQQLAAELDRMAKQNEREEAFWAAQEHRCAALLQRSEMADRTSKEVVRYFEQTNRAVSRTLAEMAAPSTLPLGSAETGSLKEACAATEQIRHVVVDQLTEVRDKQLQHCLQHATSLSRVMAERVQAANAIVSTASRDLKREREQLKANWASYDKAVQERVKCEFSEHAIRLDPLLPLRSLLPPPTAHSHSAASHPAPPSTPVLQNAYRTHLSTLFIDLKTEEERRIEQTKAFLLQSLMSLSAVVERIQQRIRDGIVAVTSVDAVDDLHHFIESNDLALAESEMEAFRAARKLSAPAEPVRKLSAQPPATADAPMKNSAAASDASTVAAQPATEATKAEGVATDAVVAATPAAESSASTEQSASVSITAAPDQSSATPTASTNGVDTTAAATPLVAVTTAPASTAPAAPPTPTTVISASAPATAVPTSTASLAPPTTTAQPLLPTPTVFSLQPPTRDPSLLHRMYALEVEREGVLHRPGKYLRKWKEQWVVVSKSGWLHCWDDRSEAQPTVSMPLVDVHAQIEKGGGGIELVSTAYHPTAQTSGGGGGIGGIGGGGLFAGSGGAGGKKEAGGVVTQTFRADNPMEAARWIESINKYCHPA